MFYPLRVCLSTSEEELVGVLSGVVVDHRVGRAQCPVLGLESLDDGHVHERAAELVAELLRDLHVPVGRLLDVGELGRLLALGERGGGHLGKDGLELLDGLLAESGADELDARRVEGDGDDEVGHFFLIFSFFKNRK